MKTGIQWTDETRNVAAGCTRIKKANKQSGCDNCYAFQLHDMRHVAWKRGHWPDAPAQYHQPFSRVQMLPDRLVALGAGTKPRRIFVNSMSDLFHKDITDDFLIKVWGVMAASPQHTYQILTKRPERMLDWLHSVDQTAIKVAGGEYLAALPLAQRKRRQRTLARIWQWPLPNVWLGTSVEDQEAADERIPLLLKTPAAVRFLSCEPLLGPVNLEPALVYYDRNGEPYGLRNLLHWVIIGGESGPHARAMDESWLTEIMWQCDESGVPVFVKQMGTMWAKTYHAKDHHGGNWDEWPEHLRVREFPTCAQPVEVPA